MAVVLGAVPVPLVYYGLDCGYAFDIWGGSNNALSVSDPSDPLGLLNSSPKGSSSSAF